MIGDRSRTSRCPSGPASTGQQRYWLHEAAAAAAHPGGSITDRKSASWTASRTWAPMNEYSMAVRVSVAAAAAFSTVTLSRHSGPWPGRGAGLGGLPRRRHLRRQQAHLATKLPPPAHKPAGNGAGGIQHGLDVLVRRHFHRRAHARGKLAEAVRPEGDLLIRCLVPAKPPGGADGEFVDGRESAVIRAFGGPSLEVQEAQVHVDPGRGSRL